MFHVRGHRGKCCLAQEERKFLKDLQAAERGRSEFVKTRKQAMEDRKEHAAECKAWLTSLNQGRWGELEEIRGKRRDDIFDKLEDLGYAEELDYLGELSQTFGRPTPALLMFDDHADVKVSKPLTERGKPHKFRNFAYLTLLQAGRIWKNDSSSTCTTLKHIVWLPNASVLFVSVNRWRYLRGFTL
ncbi:hypothetical protein B0H17DRAFT_1097590, partial [Mycena rosella]